MPYKSDAQRRWAHTPAGEKALGGPAKVAEWDSASKGLKLPERKAAAPAVPTIAHQRVAKKLMGK